MRLTGVCLALGFLALFTAFKAALEPSQPLKPVIDFGFDALDVVRKPANVAFDFAAQSGNVAFQFVAEVSELAIEFAA